MDTIELKEHLQKYIDDGDDKFLSLVLELAQNYQVEKKKTGDIKKFGKPFTKEELITRAKKAENDIASGRIISHIDLEKEVENW